MSADAKTYTERDLILAKRAAFVKGGIVLGSNGTLAFMQYAERVADQRYPLPKITRPRVVTLPDAAWCSREWRYVGGNLQSRTAGKADAVWTHSAQITPNPTAIKALAELIANPTEEVEADA